ncbi:putative RNA methyltransferase, TrmH family [Candidatus Carsonella ruddii CS isolate Thao2000]|uniref:Putative RNA methyltransferase, TrmH family n=1 Tax=Candidatus Carsonella ruddii CS isolate Thao2000 TaxID=1202537 RepID=J7H0A2_CARRU|nr:RNA methyltransferase TrmH [Candidatus Carsonella ruddii]AFP83725.1 putative RNA methyltransferase, TrmH family [Candidatus Carsonella ruddii CS isolate Thao2000]
MYFLKNYGNILSCIRTCFIFNVYCIIKKNINDSFINFNNFLKINKIYFFLKNNKKNYLLISLSIKSFLNILNFNLKQSVIILLGNEKNSLNKKFFLLSDIILKIKTYCKKSLNVNVVNGICLFKLLKYDL